jgi:hypothetical protein
MSDEIYKLMKKNLKEIKKVSAPIEGIFDAESDNEEIIGELYSGRDEHKDFDRPLQPTSHTTEDYIEYAKNIAEKIFIFTVDVKSESPTVKRLLDAIQSRVTPIEKERQFFGKNIPRIEISFPISFLDSFPEIKQTVESKLSGEKLEDVIVIFMNSGRKTAFHQERSPLFLIHDLRHAIFYMYKGITARFSKYIANFMSSIYRQNDGSRFNIEDDMEDPSKFLEIFSDLRIRRHVVDFEYHLFSLALAYQSGYIKFPESFKITPYDDRDPELTFYYDSEKTKEDAEKEFEETILKFSNSEISKAKGRVMFSLI